MLDVVQLMLHPSEITDAGISVLFNSYFEIIEKVLENHAIISLTITNATWLGASPENDEHPGRGPVRCRRRADTLLVPGRRRAFVCNFMVVIGERALKLRSCRHSSDAHEGNDTMRTDAVLVLRTICRLWTDRAPEILLVVVPALCERLEGEDNEIDADHSDQIAKHFEPQAWWGCSISFGRN
jgi:hypothetical protein